jgi:hypothetical protein
VAPPTPGAGSSTDWFSPAAPRREKTWHGTPGRSPRETRSSPARLLPQPVGSEELEAWTEELAVSGAAVRRHRVEALAEWRRFFEDLARDAGPEYASIRADYPAGDETVDTLRAACNRMLPSERRRGHSLCGPHRDELVWTRSARAFSERGVFGRGAPDGRARQARGVARRRACAGGEPRVRGRRLSTPDSLAPPSRAFLEALPQADQTILTTASEPGRWKGRAAVLHLRAGRVLRPAAAAAAGA